jgi:hypothetical protein
MECASRSRPARAELETALSVAAETGNTYEEASAHRDLTESHHSAGDHGKARFHWHAAITRFALLGAAEASQIRKRLAEVGLPDCADNSSGVARPVR